MSGRSMTSPIRVAHVVWRISLTGGVPLVVRDLRAALKPRSTETSVVSVGPAYASLLAAPLVDPLGDRDRKGAAARARSDEARFDIAVAAAAWDELLIEGLR